jgi:hypothetical protein
MLSKPVIGERQDSGLSRRVVHLIKDRLEPSQIFKMITKKECWYTKENQEEFGCRDRALMSICFAEGGRATEITGGPVFRWDKVKKKAKKVNEKRHYGIQVDNIDVNENHILFRNAPVVKRSERIIKKYGITATIRDLIAIPLKRSLYANPFWDQLVPFGWLINEYLIKYAPKTGKLFLFEDTRAYQIIREVTGNYPNWFRSQCENFYGHYLLTDSVKLSKFVNIQDPKHVKHYIGYDWTEQLRDKTVSMDFNWITPAINQIKARIGGLKG